MANHLNEKWIVLHTPVHSDYLVYWTGRDIMRKYGIVEKKDFANLGFNIEDLWKHLIQKQYIDCSGNKLPNFFSLATSSSMDLDIQFAQKKGQIYKILYNASLSANQREYPDNLVKECLQRLKDILKYGLWMTKRKKADVVKIKHSTFLKPNIARVCFTELKISDSLLHAKNFGPLGIGFKRLFVVNRLGGPMFYISQYGHHHFFPPFIPSYDPNSPDFERYAFFKNMSSGRDIQSYIAYDLYEESEWRIICSETIKSKLRQRKQQYFINPADPSTGDYHKYYQTLGVQRPEYLAPVDEWFALIIYPNLQIKNKAFNDTELRTLLSELKNKNKLTGKTPIRAEGIPKEEVVNFPAEIDIGAIKNY